MAQPEYMNCERKKEVQCEITCLDIKATSTDSLKMLVFKLNKNDKNEKRKIEDINQLMGDYNENHLNPAL